jgi:hypothetical protein
MFRRLLVAVASLALAAPLAHAQEAAARLPLRESIARMTPRVDLTELFARLGRNADTVETADGVNSRTIVMEMVVARIGADGKPVMACVDNAAAAQRFFEASLESVGRRKAQQQ